MLTQFSVGWRIYKKISSGNLCSVIRQDFCGVKQQFTRTKSIINDNKSVTVLCGLVISVILERNTYSF